ncbi:MAG: hypothetical protein L6W00_11525 [Lentisphaeria bacterium]|nr:MAG: hypothetical protein L6W00_11525 [Lentisphaeria bacterium]
MFHSREIVTAVELGSSKICVLIGEAGEGGAGEYYRAGESLRAPAPW